MVGFFATGCGQPTGKIRIDGSSTVYPISEAVAEAYTQATPGARVTVGLSGTGGGFQKFAAGEIDICDASREIRESEQQACKESEPTTSDSPSPLTGSPLW